MTGSGPVRLVQRDFHHLLPNIYPFCFLVAIGRDVIDSETERYAVGFPVAKVDFVDDIDVLLEVFKASNDCLLGPPFQ